MKDGVVFPLDFCFVLFCFVRTILSHTKQFLKSKVFCNFRHYSEKAIMLNNPLFIEIG